MVGFIVWNDISLIDLHRNFQSTGQIVGTLEWTQEKVLFRPGDVLAWDGASIKQELRSRDLIYTEAKASAKVALTAQSDIELGEKTLLALETIDGEPLIKVLSGSIKVKNDSKNRIHIKVRNHDSLVLASGTAVAMGRSDRGDLGLSVFKGQVQHGNTLVIAGQKAKFDQKGDLTQVQMVSVELDEPSHGKEIYINGGKTALVEFSWIGKSVTDVKLQVSKDARFDQIILDKKAEDGKNEAFLEVGQYYWRVKFNQKGKSQTSEVRVFRLVPQPKVQKVPGGLLEPPKIRPKLKLEKSQSSRSKIFFGGRLNLLFAVVLTYLWGDPARAGEPDGTDFTASTRFQWPAVDGAKAYLVEVSHKIDFQHLIWHGTVVYPEVDLKTLGVGVYYLRIATVNQEGRRGAYSSPSLLEIMAKKTPPPQKPKAALVKAKIPKIEIVDLVSPPDGASFETKIEGEYVSLVWKPALGPKCQQYTIELVARDKGAAQNVQRLAANFHQWKVYLKPGHYLWRVRSESTAKSSECPQWSKTRLIAIEKAKAPQIQLQTAKEIVPLPVAKVPDNPVMTIIALMAPGTFHYQSEKLEPEISLDARFFNHFGVGITSPLGREKEVGWGGFLMVKRLSAVLFNKQTEDVMEAQPEIQIQLYESELGIRWDNQAGLKPPLAFGLSLGISLVAKDHGLLIWSEANLLSLSKVLTYFPKAEGEVSLGVTYRSQLFCGYSFGSSGRRTGSEDRLQTMDISGGWSTRMEPKELVSELSLGVTLNSSQGTFNSKPTPYSFKTTRKLVVMSMAKEI
jgi:hypothetical protein